MAAMALLVVLLVVVDLNLPAEKRSHGMRRLAALEAPGTSFEDAQAAIVRQTGSCSASASCAS